jgi:plasmid stabilization system protein ParE
MGYEVKITSRANRDLIEILDYIESRENDLARQSDSPMLWSQKP